MWASAGKIFFLTQFSRGVHIYFEKNSVSFASYWLHKISTSTLEMLTE
jgi:hypothetical protein